MKRASQRTASSASQSLGGQIRASQRVAKKVDLVKLPKLIVGLAVLVFSILFYGSFWIPAPTSTAPVDRVNHQQSPKSQRNAQRIASPEQASGLISNFRNEFVTKYGPSAMDWYHKAITAYGSLDTTASRLLASKDKFVIAFAGYSVTVGRGNHFSQSFPFVLEKLLKPLLTNILSLDLEVRNSAIGGIPSFPYAFCLSHFLGEDADVISWDYSMNEGNGAAILESYIRLSQKALSQKQPMIIVLDKNHHRKKLVQEYTNMGILLDSLFLSRADQVIPKEVLQEKDETKLPRGLWKWDEFGAPDGCPGKSSWHPKRAEHEFLGHVLAMYFVDALERAVELETSQRFHGFRLKSTATLPKPLVQPMDNPVDVTQLLYGHPNGDAYELKDLSCRTSFLPAQDHDKVLPSVIVDGLATENPDIMDERSDALYATGWVLDVSKIERETKKKVERCGGLGYIDMKIALYGIPESGRLRLWLPYEGNRDKSNGDSADAFFDSLIVCEANEKRDDGACKLDSDLRLTVGGIPTNGAMVNGAGVYLKRQTCLHVVIPKAARVTHVTDLSKVNGDPLTSLEQARLLRTAPNDFGLVVDIEASPAVTRAAGACCVSHIVWEQH